MIEVIKFIGRIFRVALVMSSVISLVWVILPYIFDRAQSAELSEIIISGDISAMRYELLRAVVKFVLVASATAIVVTVLFGLIEFAAIVWRAKGFQARYFKRIQSTVLKSKMEYETLFDVCEDAAMAHCTDIKTDKHRGVIEAETKSKLTGLREKVTIAVRKDGSVQISSKTVTKFASLYDTSTWGRNVKNVRILAEYLRLHAGGQ